MNRYATKGDVSGADTRLHAPGCYRVTIDADHFGQVIRGRYYTSVGGLQDRFERDERGRFWRAEIRRTETGELVRHAGIWRSRRDAISELVDPVSSSDSSR